MRKLLPLLFLASCAKPTGGVTFIPYAQAIDVAAQNCNTVVETIIYPDGGQCPTTPLAGRRSITLCNDPRNLSADAGVPYAVVRSDQRDGGAASMTDVGVVLAAGDCAGYALTAGQPTRCAADSSDAGIRTIECR